MLQRKPDIERGFVFRIRELHVVFCALKFMGKFIDESRLDQAFDETGTFNDFLIDNKFTGNSLTLQNKFCRVC